MAKLHSYYITNAKSELKFAFNDLSEDKFEATIQEALSKVYSTQDIIKEPISDEDDVIKMKKILKNSIIIN